MERRGEHRVFDLGEGDVSAPCASPSPCSRTETALVLFDQFQLKRERQFHHSCEAVAEKRRKYPPSQAEVGVSLMGPLRGLGKGESEAAELCCGDGHGRV